MLSTLEVSWGDSEAGRVLLGPRCVPVASEAPGGRMGWACGLSAKVRSSLLCGTQALWLWAPAQLLEPCDFVSAVGGGVTGAPGCPRVQPLAHPPTAP